MKISLGVLVITSDGAPRVTTMSWMSGSQMPSPVSASPMAVAPMAVQLSPPSRLRRTPSTSMPAQTMRLSLGSMTKAVARGSRTLGQLSAKGTFIFSHVRPASRVRKKALGPQPAITVLGSLGSTAMAHTW